MITELGRTLYAALALLVFRPPEARLRLRPAWLFWFMAAANCLVSVLYDYLGSSPPRVFVLEGVALDALYLLLILAGATWITQLIQRQVFGYSLAIWWLGVNLWTGLASALLVLAFEHSMGAPSWWLLGGEPLLLLWTFAVAVYAARWLLGADAGLRSAAWTVAVYASLVLLTVRLDLPMYFRTRPPPSATATLPPFQPEAVMYAQHELLERALERIRPGQPGRIELFVLAVAADGHEPVFGNEVEYVERLFSTRFDAHGRVLRLSNDPRQLNRHPMASLTALERALPAIGRKMNAGEDILFLFLTSHGSENHELIVQRHPFVLRAITPGELRRVLDQSGIRHRVIVVSACYSGGFLTALSNPDSVVMTAARDDRPSFGCGPDAEITYFGEALLHHGLNAANDLIAAFELARTRVTARERALGHEPSEPQMQVGDNIRIQLERWARDRVFGPPVPFISDARCPGGAPEAPCTPP